MKVYIVTMSSSFGMSVILDVFDTYEKASEHITPTNHNRDCWNLMILEKEVQ